MNDELKTKEYLKKLEQLKLSDSSRLRMREELLAHARFHATPDTSSPKAVLSPFLSFLMRPASAALAMVLLVGTTAFYLNKDTSSELAIVDSTGQSNEVDTKTSAEDISSSFGEGTAENKPSVVADNPTPSSQSQSDTIAMGARSLKTAPAEETNAEDTASDEMFMTTELSAGTWSITDHLVDVAKRIEGLRSLVKKYDSKLETNTKTEFDTKLTTAEKLKVEAEGKTETDARTNLDKASTLIGEVESTLSTLGEVVVEDGYIVDVKFK
jgi:hypothetical protein